MRTRYSFYNMLISIISGVLLPVLGFVKVRLFISLYGDALNGLYLVFNQIISYINICELSFSLAFRQLLFDPLARDDREKVNEIYSGVANIYHIVGWIVIISSIIVSFGVPLFTDKVVSSLEMSALFLLMCLPFGISYFILPPSLVIIADQKEYKVSFWIQTIAIIRMVLMILVIRMRLSYVLIFVIEGLNVLISNIVSNWIARKEYPWLKRNKNIKSNKDFLASAKATTVQRLSNVAINNSDSIIINLMMNLRAVSVYGAYSYLIEAAMKIINSVISSPINSFGNLFSTDKDASYSVFEEFYEFSSYMATLLAVCIFAVLDEFVVIWVNQSSYVLPISASVIFSINVFYLTQRESIILIRDANRLFIEAEKNAYLMTAVKIILSFLFVYRYGLVGVLLGTLVAYGTVDLLYNPRLVYEKVFDKDSRIYYGKLLVRLILTAVIASISYMIYQRFIPYVSGSLVKFILSLGAIGIISLVLVTVAYYSLFPQFRRFISRVIRLISSRKAKEYS